MIKGIENGSITLNGMTDADLVMILQIKEKHESTLDFSPQQLQATQTTANQPSPGKKFYNNVILIWKNNDGLKAVFQIVENLLREEKKPE